MYYLTTGIFLLTMLLFDFRRQIYSNIHELTMLVSASRKIGMFRCASSADRGNSFMSQPERLCSFRETLSVRSLLAMAYLILAIWSSGF